VIWFF